MSLPVCRARRNRPGPHAAVHSRRRGENELRRRGNARDGEPETFDQKIIAGREAYEWLIRASDQAADVTGQCFGASGYRITRYTHMKMDRAIFSIGPWDIDKLFEVFKSTLGQGLEAVNMAALADE